MGNAMYVGSLGGMQYSSIVIAVDHEGAALASRKQQLCLKATDLRARLKHRVAFVTTRRLPRFSRKEEWNLFPEREVFRNFHLPDDRIVQNHHVVDTNDLVGCFV